MPDFKGGVNAEKQEGQWGPKTGEDESFICLFFQAWLGGGSYDKKVLEEPLRAIGAGGGETWKFSANRLGPEAESWTEGLDRSAQGLLGGPECKQQQEPGLEGLKGCAVPR